eukprot:scaffold20775_cov109-Isochrysis_galbana.AAC.9
MAMDLSRRTPPIKGDSMASPSSFNLFSGGSGSTSVSDSAALSSSWLMHLSSNTATTTLKSIIPLMMMKETK